MVKFMIKHFITTLFLFSLIFLFIQGHLTSQTATTYLEMELTEEEIEFIKNHPVIRVGNEDDWPPFDFSRNGVPQGYSIDYLNLLGRRLGITFEYTNGYTWTELLELFSEGKIDLLPSLWITESRKKTMLFTNPYIELNYVLVTKRNNNSVKNFDDLKYRTVAAPSGYKQEEILRTQFPQIRRYEVNNTLDGLKAISYGNADAFIGYRGVVDYLITTQFFTDLKIVGEISEPVFCSEALYMAVRKDMPLLRDLLNKAMRTISKHQEIELARQWISVEKKSVPDLSDTELSYLRRYDKIRVNNLQNWPPFNFYENEKAKGFCVDYMKLLETKLGVEIEFVSGPSWNEFLSMVDDNSIDLLCDIVETPKRREKYIFTQPYFTIFSGIVVRKENAEQTDINSLAGKRVVVPKGFYYIDILNEHYPDINIITEIDMLACLQSVSLGSADAAISEKPVSDYLIENYFLTDLVSLPIINSAHFKNTAVSMGFKNDNIILRNIFQKAIDSVTTAERNNIYSLWFDVDDLEQQQSNIALTPEEQEFLNRTNKITMAVNPLRYPFERLEGDNTYTGIFSDFYKLLSEKIGVDFEVIQTNSWDESIRSVQSGSIDILSGTIDGAAETSFLLQSKTFFESPAVIIATEDTPYVSDLQFYSNKKVAVVADSPLVKYISRNYPAIQLQFYNDLDSALISVSNGINHAAIGSLQLVSYKLHSNNLYNLKIAGQTPYKDHIKIGINNESVILKSILDKAIDSLSEKEINDITQKWLAIKYEMGFDYSLFWKLFAGILLIIAVILFWNRKLRVLNSALRTAHKELETKSKTLEVISQTDALTEIYNRMKLDEILENECERANRTKTNLSIIIADIDKFKQINDQYGHHTGDIVLKRMAELIVLNTRAIDSVGRWGGEEFLTICPGTDIKGAVNLAQKIRLNIENFVFPVKNKCTCSFGVTQFRPGERIDDLFIRADILLYRAKENGRNQVVHET
jgi:polar amino acid transport system substrate-binding protein